MSWIYPEQWPGWLDHARQGGGMFDSPESFTYLIQQCWQHYIATSGVAQRVTLTPPPELRLTFRADALNTPAWQSHFVYLSEYFHPTLHGVQLPLSLQFVESEQNHLLPELRNFSFQVGDEQLLALRCHFYLGRQAVGVAELGQIHHQGGRRRLKVQRSLLGTTKGSDIANCYQANVAWDQLPAEMQRDLKYLGWSFAFTPEAGMLRASIEDLPAMGLPEGGEFLLTEGQTFTVGEAIDFYQGLDQGRPSDDLLCRLLIVPSEIQPTAPTLEAVDLVLHHDTQHRQTPQLHASAWVKGAMPNATIELQVEPGSHRLILSGGQPSADGLLLFQGVCDAWQGLAAGQELRCIPHGTNRYGLSFPPNLAQTAQIRQAVALHYEGVTALSKAQLQREWELTFLMSRADNTPDFDLNALTLALCGTTGTTLHIPLANIVDDRLFFRYLPRFASQQVPLEELSEGDVLSMWVEYQAPTDAPELSTFPVLSTCHNRPDVPLQTVRLLNLDETSRLLPAQKTVGIPSDAELSIEGYRLQLVGPLTMQGEPDKPPETWDLLLWAPPQPRRLDLLHRGGSWMQALSPPRPSSEVPVTSHRDIRSLWLSCGHQDTWIEHPQERNPTGGPCLAFGLGFGSQNEMAQIRPTPDGFRLYRHRHNTAVALNGVWLAVESYQDAQGVLLTQEHSYGWLLVDRALLRYRIDQVQQTSRLSLQLVGYLLKRPAASQTLQVLCGDTSTLHPPPPAQSQVPQLRLAPELRPTVLTLSLPQHPVHHTYPPLLVQEGRTEKLSAPLKYGHPYRRQQLTLMAWQIHDPGTRQVTQHPDLPMLPLLLECASVYGRTRYALVRRQGRLGYWYEGSQFIEQSGEAEPMLAPDYTRTTPEGQEIPPHTLLVGSDVTQADLLLPPSLRWSHDLPFGLMLQDQQLTIIPLQGSCSLWTWQPSGEGVLQHQETTTGEQALQTKLPASGQILFRCEQYLFELSTAPTDLQTTPHAEMLLSIRGVFHSALTPITVGGPAESASLSIADPIPSHPHDQPLLQIYTPGLSLCYRGEGIIGLQQGTSHDTLQRRLEHDLAATSYTFDASTPLHLLSQITTQDTPHQEFPQPPLLHDRTSLQWPEGFLRPSSRLQIDGLTLQYHLRQSPDLYPPPERVPAWLALPSAPTFSIPFAPAPDGFLMPAASGESRQLSVIHIGRYDPESAYAETALSQGEALFSQPVEEEEISAKINLFGFLPRFAARLLREDGQLYLDIPTPAQDSPYHIVLMDQPMHTASRHPIEQPLYFHINHLVVCALFPQAESVRFELLGYLLGHQRDPARPVIVGQTNRVGCIHLHSIPYHAKIALQRSVCPPHFVRPSEDSLEPAENSSPDGAQEDNQVLDGERSLLQRRTFGPLSLPDGSQAALVDFQQEQAAHPALQRPPHCDRLLWFVYNTAHSGYLFPDTEPPPPPVSQASSPESAVKAPGFAGSSFFFDDLEDSQGSSFFFDDPAEESLPTPPRPVLSVPTDAMHAVASTDTESAADSRYPSLHLGWFQAGELTSPAFGYVSDQPGPNVTLRLLFRRLRLVPNVASHTPQALPPIALWRMGRWQPVYAPCDLPEESLLLCGRAVFSIHFQADTARALVRRRWLWLPQGQTVSLHGMSPQDLISIAAKHLPPDTQEELLASPTPIDAPPSTGTDSFVSSGNQETSSSNGEESDHHEEAPEQAPQAPQPASQHEQLTLTDFPPGEHCRIMSAQRGHRVEVKQGLQLVETSDGWKISAAPTNTSTSEQPDQSPLAKEERTIP